MDQKKVKDMFIKAKWSSKKDFNGWWPYLTSLCKGETREDAIARIKADNPSLNFKDFDFVEE